MADTESTPLVNENGADASFQGLEEHLVQCFVNCIARKNAAQRSYNKISNLGNAARNWMGTKKDPETGEVLSTPGLQTDISSKAQRETAIRNALQKVMAMENLADLKVTGALSSAFSTNMSSMGRMFSRKKAEGGKRRRKTKKNRKGKKSRKH